MKKLEEDRHSRYLESYSFRVEPKLLQDLKDAYPDMRVSEAVRFSIAYTLQKLPKSRLIEKDY